MSIKAVSELKDTATLAMRNSLNAKTKSDGGEIKQKIKETDHDGGTYLDSSGPYYKRVGQVDTSGDTASGTSPIPCTCGQQARDGFTESLSDLRSSPSSQGKCRDCGCGSPSATFSQPSRSLINEGCSLNVNCQQETDLAEPLGISRNNLFIASTSNSAEMFQVPESPILATQ